MRILRRKGAWLLVGTICLIIAVLATGCGKGSAPSGGQSGTSTPAPAAPAEETKPIELRYATYISSTNFVGQVDLGYFEKVQQETQGKVKVIPFWNNTLFDSKQWYTELTKGTADIVHVQPGTEKERFPLYTAITTFSYGANSYGVLEAAMEELWKTTPEWQEEFKKADVRPLTWFVPGEAWIHSNKPVRKAEDLKGLNIRCADDMSFELVKALGANPVRMPISEVYQALQKGMVDGTLTSMDTIVDYRFIEVTKYHTKLPYFLAWVVYRAVQDSRWAQLPADVQASFEKNAQWWETEVMNGLKQKCAEAEAAAKQQGHEVIELSPAERDKFIAALDANAQRTCKGLDAKGYPCTEIWKKSRELIAKYNQTLK